MWSSNLRSTVFFIVILSISIVTRAQRTYVQNSVLATGTWYKIATKEAGIYKIDVSFLNNLGINTTSLNTNYIRLFSNNEWLDENNASFRYDDLQEHALAMYDGGDGLFNNNDYLLFYATGADKWLKDSLNQRFVFQKNIYSDSAYFFLSVDNGVGKRIQTNSPITGTATPVNSFHERYHYEQDLVNFLNSGKEWYGEEYNLLSSGSNVKNFNIDVSGIMLNDPIYLNTNFVARSVGASSSFIVAVNNQNIQTHTINPVSGNYLDLFGIESNRFGSFFSNNANTLSLTTSFLSQGYGSQGWLNNFDIFYRKGLQLSSNIGTLFFRDWTSVFVGTTAEFIIGNASNSTEVWDITNVFLPVRMQGSFGSGQYRFKQDASRLREYVAFNANQNFPIPIRIGKVNNQNLHNTILIDYLIITPKAFIASANKLAAFHQQQYGYKVNVVPVDMIYNEFSGGINNPIAIRDFVKMYYDKALGDTTKQPRYLLLMGASSFDYKNRVANNSNIIPCYESSNSLDPLASFTSDDFFGFLDDNENINSFNQTNLLNIAIGRLPVKNNVEADIVVNKIIEYHSSKSFGAWRNNSVYVADDKDMNTHLSDAELIASNAMLADSIVNQVKIYLDAYKLTSGSGGGRYPQVNAEIVNQFNSGCLFFNYSGHGGYQRLADEAILGQEELSLMNNANRYPLLITATCDFVPHDDPTKIALGNQFLISKDKGAIGLLTTTRVVFAFSNRLLNDAFLKRVLSNRMNKMSIGMANRMAKNSLYTLGIDAINNKKFTLIGDPGIRLAFPQNTINLDKLNGMLLSTSDTLKPLNKYTFTGTVMDAAGSLNTNFSGSLDVVIFDQKQTVKTLGNDPASPITSFLQQTNVVFKGKAAVENGKFLFTCVIPKDISSQIGKARISLYADNQKDLDASGYNEQILIGGINLNPKLDVLGPEIKLYLNDNKFANGGMVNNRPILLVNLFDSSGINTTGTGIGHDITATIDGDDKNAFLLNNFYTADNNTYQSGLIRYQLPILSSGYHQIKLKAWDVYNNSSERSIDFYVESNEQLHIGNLYNYPNPFTNKTNFWVNHNQPGNTFQVLVSVYTITGKIVKEFKNSFSTSGNRLELFEWDGRDENNQKLAKGVYIYRILVKNSQGQTASALQKMFVL